MLDRGEGNTLPQVRQPIQKKPRALSYAVFSGDGDGGKSTVRDFCKLVCQNHAFFLEEEISGNNSRSTSD